MTWKYFKILCLEWYVWFSPQDFYCLNQGPDERVINFSELGVFFQALLGCCQSLDVYGCGT